MTHNTIGRLCHNGNCGNPGKAPAGRKSFTYLVEGLAKVLREKRVEKGVDAGAGVGHNMRYDLKDEFK